MNRLQDQTHTVLVGDRMVCIESPSPSSQVCVCLKLVQVGRPSSSRHAPPNSASEGMSASASHFNCARHQLDNPTYQFIFQIIHIQSYNHTASFSLSPLKSFRRRQHRSPKYRSNTTTTDLHFGHPPFTERN